MENAVTKHSDSVVLSSSSVDSDQVFDVHAQHGGVTNQILKY
jgi:hypothetical protein